MSDASGATETGNPPPPPTPDQTTQPPPAVPEPDPTDWKKEAEKAKADADSLRALARKHEDRAKVNGAAAKELEQLRRETMTEAEKQIAEARNAGRREALLEVSHERVHSEFKAAAAGKLDARAIEVLVQGLNASAFVDPETGIVDVKAIGEFVTGIAPQSEVPPPDPRFPELGQGQRSQPALNGDGLESALRAAVGLS